MSYTDPRTIRTKAAFRTALTDLVAARAEISVASLCRWSGLNRGTFYLHYRDVSDLAEDAVRHLVHEITVPWKLLDPVDPQTFERDSIGLIGKYLRHLAAHRLFYQWVLGPDGNWRIVRALLDEYSAVIAQGIADQDYGPVHPGPHAPLLADLLGGALFGVVSRWVEDPPEISPDAVARWLWAELTVHPVTTPRMDGTVSG